MKKLYYDAARSTNHQDLNLIGSWFFHAPVMKAEVETHTVVMSADLYI